jgi:phosphate transport system substrate-binding protein
MHLRHLLCLLLISSLMSATRLGSASQAGLDRDLKPFRSSVSGISGSVKSIGSDTMNNLMTLWAEGFRSVYPSVTIEVEGKGSSTAPAALIAGAASFGPMSRAMKDKELTDFENAFGYKPVALPAAIDMLAVYVNKDNPIRSLTLAQVDAIFSKPRLRGHPSEIRTWGDLGLTGEWAERPISVYGRNSASGTYGFFKERALANGDFKDSVMEQPGSSSVVQGIASDRYGIGYSGIGYSTADVRALALKPDAKSAPVAAEAANAYTGKYPLSRFLFVYVNYKPGAQLDPLRSEFVRYVFSREGQADVLKDGYYPVTASIATKALASVGLASAADAQRSPAVGEAATR